MSTQIASRIAGAHCASNYQLLAQFAVLGIAEVPHRRASPAGLLKNTCSSIARISNSSPTSTMRG